jgi:hypothetical protein
MTPNLGDKASLLIILIASLLVLQACIIPIPWGSDRFSNDKVYTVTAGLSNKDEVLGTFGEPDIIWETEQNEDVFVYKWERVRAFIIVYPAPGAVGPLSTDEALLILFSRDNCVKRIEKATKSAFESYGDFLTRWLGQSGR